jgi:hypothetical protein
MITTSLASAFLENMTHLVLKETMPHQLRLQYGQFFDYTEIITPPLDNYGKESLVSLNISRRSSRGQINSRIVVNPNDTV